MTTLEFLLFINAIAFSLLVYFFNKRTQRLTPTLFTTIFWAIAAIFGFLYVYDCDYWIGQGPATIESVVSLFALFVIYAFPLVRLKGFDNNTYIYSDSKITLLLTYILAAISVIPFVENFLHLFNGRTINEMGSYHDERTMALLTERMSFLGVKCTIILGWFKYVIPALLFNYLNYRNKKRKTIVVIGLFLSFFNNTLSSFCNGERFIAVQDGCLFTFFFLLFYDTLEKRIRYMIIRYGVVIFTLAACGLAIISIYRFGNSDNETLLQSLYRYFGEGFNNFYTDMWYVDRHTYGANIFRGMIEGVSAETLTLYTGVRMHCYYTFIGDFVCDFGLCGTFVLFMIISIFIYRMILGKISIVKVMILVLYSTILLTGSMYTPFMNASEQLFGFIVCLILVLLFDKK